MQKVNEIVITIYVTILYVLTSKFGLLVPFSKIISQNLKINLLAVETIIFGFMFYIFFRIGYSIIGFKFGLEAFNIGAQYGPVITTPRVQSRAELNAFMCLHYGTNCPPQVATVGSGH